MKNCILKKSSMVLTYIPPTIANVRRRMKVLPNDDDRLKLWIGKWIWWTVMIYTQDISDSSMKRFSLAAISGKCAAAERVLASITAHNAIEWCESISGLNNSAIFFSLLFKWLFHCCSLSHYYTNILILYLLGFHVEQTFANKSQAYWINMQCNKIPFIAYCKMQ